MLKHTNFMVGMILDYFNLNCIKSIIGSISCLRYAGLCVCGTDLLDAVDAPLIRLCDEQCAQVGQGDGFGSLQGGAHCGPAHQVVVNTRNLAVDGTSRHNTYLKNFWHLKKYIIMY